MQLIQFEILNMWREASKSFELLLSKRNLFQKKILHNN